MKRRDLMAGAAALVGASGASWGQGSGAPTKVTFWHAMPGVLGEEVNRLCAGFNGS